MFGNLGLHVIKNPAGTYSYVGSIPRALGSEVKASTAAVIGGRAYTNAAGEIVETQLPAFATRDEAVAHAKACGFEVAEA